MKILRRLKTPLAAALLLAIGASAPPKASAELLMNENFEYAAGDLYGNGGWIVAGNNKLNPIQLVEPGLSKAGYQAEAKGLSALLTHYASDNANSQDLQCPFTEIIKNGKIYMAMLLNVEEVPALTVNPTSVITFAGPSSSGAFADGSSLSFTNDFGYVYLVPGEASGTFKLRASKKGTYNNNPEMPSSEDLAIGTTHLIVLAYEIVEGTKNDKLHLWINPASGFDEPAATLISNDTSAADPNYGIGGVHLRQASTASYNSPTFRVDAIRAATTWAELFLGAGGGDVEDNDKPKLSTNVSSVKFGKDGFMLQGQTATALVNVQGENLTGDITITGLDGTGVTADVTTIDKDEAMSASGKNITLTYKAGTSALSGGMILTTEGVEPVVVSFSANPQPVTNVMNLAFLALVDESDTKYYCYPGTAAVVTFVDEANKYLYLQDLSGAIAVDYGAAEAGFKVPEKGDKLENVYVQVYQKYFGNLYFKPVLTELGTKNGTGDRTPASVSVSDIKRDVESHLNKLVTLSDVAFTSTGNWGTANTSATSGGQAFNVRTFAGTDLVGTPLPASAQSVTGIVTSASESSVTLSVRSAAEIVAAPASLEASVELLVDNSDYFEVGQTIEFAKVTVKASSIKGGEVWLSGANRDQFSIDVDALPAGSATTVITVTYKPTTTGTHKANLTLDVSPTELSESFSLTAKAYDPANPPQITVDSSSLTDFSCNVGETQEQTISYTAKNLLDYTGGVKVVQNVAAFQVSNTSVINGTYNITVKFVPQSEGEFTAQLVFSAPKAETVTVDLKGSTTGGREEEKKQGDELSFDTANPLASYSTDFSAAGANYQPLSLEGWKNVAVEGTRAWWSRDLDGNRAAYVTAYDSTSDDSTPCEMLLLSPALDYKNAQSRLLQFSVMGNLLLDGMNDLLEVVYIDPTGDEPYYETIEGLGLPASADYNEEWFPYVIDLEGQDLADVFFIGFRFTSLRGKESTAQYYIDDFAWGRTDVPFIRVDSNWMESSASAGESHQTEKVSVTGLNLNSEISLKVTGANASKFTLSHSTLPAAGGEFYLTFQSDEIGIHEAFVSLTAEGAPETLVYFLVNNQESLGIGFPVADSGASVDVFDLQGRPVMLGATASDAFSKLRDKRGELFIIRSGEKTYKYIAK